MAIDETAQCNQSHKFKDIEREVEADEDKARWDGQLARVVAHKPSLELEKPE